ncbi:MAG: ABC transporter ATP-binding protein, partial [Peptostreptococcaceae bacterium]
TINNKVKLQEWCKDVKGIEKNFDRESLILEKINFGYDKKNKILENINFSLKEGEILALLGNNGAGKSTLSKIITGIEKQDDGFIKLFDNNIENESVRKRGEKIGYVMQNPNHMLTQETVLKEVEFGLKIRGIKNYKEIAMDTLKICGIYEYRNWPINSLSYGQKKRVSIAAILALNPKLLILDEPTAGQDYKHYKEFMKFIKKISENKISIILITHDMHLALEYSDRAIVLSSGKIIADDTPINILSNKNIMKIANLRETSISTMAEILDIPSQLLLNYFIRC